MHYRGALASTKLEFDSSYKRGEPLVIPIGEGIVIRGRVFFPSVFDCVGSPITSDIPVYGIEVGCANNLVTVDGMKDCSTCALGINAR